jgi:hypothetical protein
VQATTTGCFYWGESVILADVEDVFLLQNQANCLAGYDLIFFVLFCVAGYGGHLTFFVFFLLKTNQMARIVLSFGAFCLLAVVFLGTAVILISSFFFKKKGRLIDDDDDC